MRPYWRHGWHLHHRLPLARELCDVSNHCAELQLTLSAVEHRHVHAGTVGKAMAQKFTGVLVTHTSLLASLIGGGLPQASGAGRG